MKLITVALQQKEEKDPLLERALETLVEIQTYVDSPTFSAGGLMRGLGKHDRSALDEDLARLLKEGYSERVANTQESMRLTMKGKTYHPEPLDDVLIEGDD